MLRLTVYLLFDGACKQAMEFYQSCFGGELSLLTVGESEVKNQMPPSMHQRVLNARLKSDNVDISASDWLRPDRTPTQGNMVCLYLSAEKPEELKPLFDRLLEGATVVDPLTEKFFGTYGALTDKFGVRWMFQATKSQKGGS